MCDKNKYEFDGVDIVIGDTDGLEEDLDEETIKEMEENAAKYLERKKDPTVRQIMDERMKKARDVSEAYTELRKEYTNNKVSNPNKDPINPEHYRTLGVEAVDLMETKYGTRALMAFCMMNVEKYTYRAGNKGSFETDMGKAKWYLDKYNELSGKLNTGKEVRGLTELI